MGRFASNAYSSWLQMESVVDHQTGGISGHRQDGQKHRGRWTNLFSNCIATISTKQKGSTGCKEDRPREMKTSTHTSILQRQQRSDERPVSPPRRWIEKGPCEKRQCKQRTQATNTRSITTTTTILWVTRERTEYCGGLLYLFGDGF